VWCKAVPPEDLEAGKGEKEVGRGEEGKTPQKR
jgi:hypothetical protein